MDISDAIDAAWDFNDPAASEERFTALAATYAGADQAEALTQKARTLGLRKRFDEAREVLGQIPPSLIESSPRLQVRWELEMGRTYNSAGDPVTARIHFENAWSVAQSHGVETLGIDAGHMIAIAAPLEEALAWNQKCLALAEAASDPKARKWRGPLLNNLGWSLMDLGRAEEALAVFERAVTVREEYGVAGPLKIAKWCVGRALREVGRMDEALHVQLALITDGGDGFAEEEAGECLFGLGRPEEAKPHFARAYLEFTESELKGAVDGERLERIRTLGT